jgi:hypothetical protein
MKSPLQSVLLLTIALAITAACGGSDHRRGLRVGMDSAGRAGAAGRDEVDNPNGSGGGGGRVQPVDNALTVHVEDVTEMAVEIVTVACAGDCVEVEAVARGGRLPYAFAWNDGVADAGRQLCARDDSAFTVSASDAPYEAGEFSYAGQTATATVQLDVLSCAPDAGVEADCDDGTDLGEITPDIFGTPTFFTEGEPLPAGRYRINYVDGCLRYEGPWGWAVNGIESYQYLVIGATTTDVLAIAPGVMASGFFGAAFDYPELEDCVAASLARPPLELDFQGGALGIWQNDFKPEDNVPGPEGRSPTWRLTRCDR